jgi:DNA-binding Xre family transcriptional regulator
MAQSTTGNQTRIGRLIRTGRADEARTELLDAAKKSDEHTMQGFAKAQGVTRFTLHRWCARLDCRAALDDALFPPH